MFSEEQEGWLPLQLCGWQWAKRSCFLLHQSTAIKKKCAILKIQKENPNHNNLQVTLTWWWPDTPETNDGRGNSNFPLLFSDKFSLFLFSRNDTAWCPVPRGLSQLGHLTTARRKTQSLLLSLENKGQVRSSRSTRSLGPAGLGSIHQIALGNSSLHSSEFQCLLPSNWR